MAPRAPATGDPLYLDGFAYILAGSKKTLDDQEHPIVHQFFERPPAADHNTARHHRSSVNYKAGGTICDQRELVWVTKPEFLAMAREQADNLVRGGSTPGARLWGDAAFKAIKEASAAWPDAFWTLPGRTLVDPPCELVDGAGRTRREIRQQLVKDGHVPHEARVLAEAAAREPRMAVPTGAAHALQLARSALDHSYYAAEAAALPEG